MWQLIVALVIVAFAYTLTPKRQPGIKAGTIETPTAEEGRPIPVLFGTRLLKGSNIVWYGDFRADAIRKKSGGK